MPDTFDREDAIAKEFAQWFAHITTGTRWPEWPGKI